MKKTQYKECNEALDWLMAKVKNTQMEREEYAYIASFLAQSNFLVFGTGYDSNYWRLVNQGGRTIFLEDDPEWIDDNKDIFQIKYTTKRPDHTRLMKEFLEGNTKLLNIRLPPQILNTKWDAILVDAPVGNSDKVPGRMQSIYTAYKLATPETEIFVHDCNRKVEDEYTSIMLEKIKDIHRLRHGRKRMIYDNL